VSVPDPDVSRETDRPAEDVLARLFPADSRVALDRYVDIATSRGVDFGLIGPREAPIFWSRHVLNCVVAAELVPLNARVCDIGSGAGLPGIVWALARPDLQLTLVDSLLRRTRFLDDVVAELGLTQVEVRRARAEDLARRSSATPDGSAGSYDVVTARAVAPLGRLLDWTMPLVRPGGEVLALKGQTADREVAQAAEALRRWRVARVRVVSLGAGLVEPETVVVRLESGQRSIPTTQGAR
jgi:16S rRNA (guanine527-N7)-methyltransferase